LISKFDLKRKSIKELILKPILGSTILWSLIYNLRLTFSLMPVISRLISSWA